MNSLPEDERLAQSVSGFLEHTEKHGLLGETKLQALAKIERIPTHRCKVCGAMWILYPPNAWAPKDNPGRNAWWSLGTNENCGPCCDNVAMGDQIEKLADAYPQLRERAYFRPQRSDPATWVLHLLVNDEISVSKAREWLRHYIQDGVQDPLPDVMALP